MLAVRALRPGQVASYGEIAMRAGRPGAARAAGNVLARGLAEVPWWRVVHSDGRLAGGKDGRQGRLLMEEGVLVVGGRIADPALRASLRPDAFSSGPA